MLQTHQEAAVSVMALNLTDLDLRFLQLRDEENQGLTLSCIASEPAKPFSAFNAAYLFSKKNPGLPEMAQSLGLEVWLTSYSICLASRRPEFKAQ